VRVHRAIIGLALPCARRAKRGRGIERRIMNYANWRIEDEIKKRVELESWVEWAEKPTPPLVNNYRPSDFHLTEAAKEAFSKGIHLVKLLRI
jgi:aminoglycoside phosphotransferase (APT) family kinase protein